MARKSKKVLLRKKADRLWSLAVRADWAGKCAVCGKGRGEAHHIIPRQHEATRYSLFNGILLCRWDHMYNPDCAPHENAAGWLEWLRDHYPKTAAWYEGNPRPDFGGIKTEEHYYDVLRELRQYVEEDDFTRIVGVTLVRYLEEQGG